LLLHRPCGFISPRSHVRDEPFRGFPSVAAAPPHRWPLPSCRLTVPPTRSLRLWRQRSGPAFRALLCAGVRDGVLGVSQPDIRSPPGLHLPRVLRLLAVPLPSQRLRS
jgi:hypothetical protein